MLVVLYHAGVPGISGGYVGVDVFFVISGFLITGMLLDELGATGRVSFARFYARRARRLLPSSALVIVTVVIASSVILLPLLVRGVADDGIASSLFVVNVRFPLQDTGYFAAHHGPSPLLHFWSLSLEEQFYAVWPALLVLVGRRATRQPRDVRRRVVAALAVIFVVSLGASIVVTAQSQPWAFFSLPTRAWEFAVGGALAAWGMPRLLSLPIRAVVTFGGLGLVIASAAVFDATTRFPGWAPLLPVVGTAAVILGGTGAPSPAAPLLGAGVMPWLGRRSYVIYLWHWPLLVLVPVVIGRALSLDERLLVCVVALGLATLTHVLVERPVHSSSWFVQRPRRGILAGAAITGGALAVSMVVLVAAPSLEGTGAAAAAVRPASVAEVQQALVAAISTRHVPRNLEPSLDDVSTDVADYVTDGCHVLADDVELPPRRCVYGDRQSNHIVVLLGDSHMGQWFTAFETIARRKGWALFPMTKSNCSAPDVVVIDNDGRRYVECEEFRTRALARIRELRPELVVMSSSAAYGAAAEAESWGPGYVATIEQLRGKAKSIVIMGDTPYPADDVPLCVSAHLDGVQACAKDRADEVNPEHRAVEVRAARDTGVEFVDPTPWVCGVRCPAVMGRILVWRDSNHLTTVYVRWLTEVVAHAVDSAT